MADARTYDESTAVRARFRAGRALLFQAAEHRAAESGREPPEVG